MSHLKEWQNFCGTHKGPKEIIDEATDEVIADREKMVAELKKEAKGLKTEFNPDDPRIALNREITIGLKPITIQRRIVETERAADKKHLELMATDALNACGQKEKPTK